LEFLFNWDCFRHELERMSPGSNRKTLTINTLYNLSIPFPPLPEQKRIVEILSLAGDLIKKQKEAIALIDKILMAKFLEMFGDPATNPKGWEIKKLKEDTKDKKRKRIWKKKNLLFSPCRGGDIPFRKYSKEYP